MPLYEYRCPNGHRVEEVFIRYQDSPKELPCLGCEELAVKQPSAPRVVIRGQEAKVDTLEESWDGIDIDLDRVDKANREVSSREVDYSFEKKKMTFDQGSKSTKPGLEV